MPLDIPALQQIRAYTQSSLQECIATLSQAQGDAIQAIHQIHQRQAQTLADATGAPFETCLRAIQSAKGDPQQAHFYLRSVGYNMPSKGPSQEPIETLIYVSVNGPKPNWYPVTAIHLHGQCYRVRSENPDPEHLYWEFRAGDSVECEEHVFAEHETGLIAIKRCDH